MKATNVGKDIADELRKLPAGAQAVYIYKTNASVRAMLDPVAAGGGAQDYGRLRSRQWGTSGNQI